MVPIHILIYINHILYLFHILCLLHIDQTSLKLPLLISIYDIKSVPDKN